VRNAAIAGWERTTVCGAQVTSIQGLQITSYNGCALIAMVGENCFAIASDRRLGINFQTIATDFQCVFKIHDQLYIGLSSLATEVQTMSVAFREDARQACFLILFFCFFTQAAICSCKSSAKTLPRSSYTRMFHIKSGAQNPTVEEMRDNAASCAQAIILCGVKSRKKRFSISRGCL